MSKRKWFCLLILIYINFIKINAQQVICKIENNVKLNTQFVFFTLNNKHVGATVRKINDTYFTNNGSVNTSFFLKKKIIVKKNLGLFDEEVVLEDKTQIFTTPFNLIISGDYLIKKEGL